MAGITTSLPAIRDEATHAKYRKLVSYSYSMSALIEYEPYIDEATEKWLAVFDMYTNSGQAMNITDWSHYCSCMCCLQLDQT
jgi:cytochrome P450